MKKSYKILMLLMVFGLVSFLAMNSAYSKCGSPVSFGQPTYCIYGGASSVPPGSQFAEDTSFFGEWWALGTGSPTDGAGNDRGTYQNDLTADWTNNYSSYCKYMPAGTNNWFNNGTDGCILDDPDLMVVAVDDKTSDNSNAFFAVGCVPKTGGPDYNFDGIGRGMYLTEIPHISIDSATPGTGNIALTLSWSDPGVTTGFGGDSCTWAQVFSGYEVYSFQGASAPTTRDPASWSLESDTDGTADNLGANVTVTDPATSGHSTWLALRLVYDSGFKSRYVGANSSQVAGPTAAGGFESVSASYLGKKNVQIDWVTNSEMAVSGFNVLRSDSPEGFFSAVNTGLIPATGVGGAGDSYTFVDSIKGIGGTFTFFYKVEMVASGDATTVQSEIVSAVLKEKGPQGPKPKR
jgi:hypothetical protein